MTGNDNSSKGMSSEDKTAYWRANIQLLVKLLAVWFLVSFGAGILFVEALNTFTILGFPVGFWFAQQGSIYVFVILIFVYTHKMKAIEQSFGIYTKGED